MKPYFSYFDVNKNKKRDEITQLISNGVLDKPVSRLFAKPVDVELNVPPTEHLQSGFQRKHNDPWQAKSTVDKSFIYKILFGHLHL